MVQRTSPVVLVVEDESLIRMMAVDAFHDDGFVVLEAEHAADALQLYESGRRFDILFTDVNMPGELNGIDLAERLKGFIPELHILVTSALPILRTVDHLPAVFVPKPYEPQSVCSVARELIAGEIRGHSLPRFA